MKSFECNDYYWFRRSVLLYGGWNLVSREGLCCLVMDVWFNLVRALLHCMILFVRSLWLYTDKQVLKDSHFFISINVIQLTKRLCPFKDRPTQEENQQGTKWGQRTSKAYKCHMISPLKHFAPLLHKATNLKETYYMWYDIFFFPLFRWGSAHNSFWRYQHIIDNSSFFSSPFYYFHCSFWKIIWDCSCVDMMPTQTRAKMWWMAIMVSVVM